jgi:acyl-CoA reductase-like NAD-dependent aldehyde dehydrogenase
MEMYAGNPAVQVHGPGYSKILIGDDAIDNWEDHLDTMVTSVFLNSGRSCINASSIWVPRHGRAIAESLARRLCNVRPRDPRDPEASLAAFTVAGVAEAVSGMIDAALTQGGATDVTALVRPGSRAITREHCSYLLPTVVHCESPQHPLANKEFMFPFVSVVECSESEMLREIGPTLVCTGITENPWLKDSLIACPAIDRLNLGPIPTTKLDWLQPHEGNIVEWLYQPRSFQLLAS